MYCNQYKRNMQHGCITHSLWDFFETHCISLKLDLAFEAFAKDYSLKVKLQPSYY